MSSFRRRSNRARPHSVSLLVAAAATFGVASCDAGSDPVTVDGWIETARDEVEASPPSDATMQIDPSAACELVDEFAVEGKMLELFGAATALFGDVGMRYQCAWSGDVNRSANARLEVVLVDEQADFDQLERLVASRSGNVSVATELGRVDVASDHPAGSSRPVETAVLLVPDQLAGVQLVIELLDDDVAASWTPRDVALQLESLTG